MTMTQAREQIAEAKPHLREMLERSEQYDRDCDRLREEIGRMAAELLREHRATGRKIELAEFKQWGMAEYHRRLAALTEQYREDARARNAARYGEWN